MRAITVRDQSLGTSGLAVEDLPPPHAAENDVIVRVHAAGFTPNELSWPGTWTDRAGRDRTPSVPGHEMSGVVHELGYGTTGFSIGQRVFGMTDAARNGTLAEFVAVETRNLAPLPADVDHTTAAALPISGLTAWQGLFVHGRLAAGQTALIHGGGGAVGSVAIQLARDAGARVVATGRARDREAALRLGAERFVDLQADDLQVVGEVDVVLDVIGGDVLTASASLVRSGGTLVTIAEPSETRVRNGRVVFFVVEPDGRLLEQLVRLVRRGRLTPLHDAVCPLEEVPTAFGPHRRAGGRTIVTIAD